MVQNMYNTSDNAKVSLNDILFSGFLVKLIKTSSYKLVYFLCSDSSYDEYQLAKSFVDDFDLFQEFQNVQDLCNAIDQLDDEKDTFVISIISNPAKISDEAIHSGSGIQNAISSVIAQNTAVAATSNAITKIDKSIRGSNFVVSYNSMELKNNLWNVRDNSFVMIPNTMRFPDTLTNSNYVSVLSLIELNLNVSQLLKSPFSCAITIKKVDQSNVVVARVFADEKYEIHFIEEAKLENIIHVYDSHGNLVDISTFLMNPQKDAMLTKVSESLSELYAIQEKYIVHEVPQLNIVIPETPTSASAETTLSVSETVLSVSWKDALRSHFQNNYAVENLDCLNLIDEHLPYTIVVGSDNIAQALHGALSPNLLTSLVSTSNNIINLPLCDGSTTKLYSDEKKNTRIGRVKVNLSSMDVVGKILIYVGESKENKTITPASKIPDANLAKGSVARLTRKIQFSRLANHR